jgi:hypothetical protein
MNRKNLHEGTVRNGGQKGDAHTPRPATTPGSHTPNRPTLFVGHRFEAGYRQLEADAYITAIEQERDELQHKLGDIEIYEREREG